jgi:hypothetical protein
MVAFEVFGQPAVAVDPGEEALDDPAPQQNLEADLIGDLLHHLDGDGGGVSDALGVVGAVGEGEFDERERPSGCLQERDGAVAVLDIGRMSLDQKRAAVGVDHGVALTALDLLAGVIAPGPACLDRLDRLAVDHRRRRRRLTPDPLAVQHDQVMVEGREQTLAAKAQEPAVDGGHRREVLGQQAPGAARPQYIEDGVHDLAHRPQPWPARPGGRRHERSNDLPLLIRQIASVAQMIAAMLPPGGRRPHDGLQAGFDNRLESHLNPTIHPTAVFQDSLLESDSKLMLIGRAVA